LTPSYKENSTMKGAEAADREPVVDGGVGEADPAKLCPSHHAVLLRRQPPSLLRVSVTLPGYSGVK
jgi:hypothetical protein